MSVEPDGPDVGARQAGVDPAQVEGIEALARQRFRIGAVLTVAMLVIYFAFILLIAFDKDFVGEMITDGLSLGIVLGVIVILSVWALTLIYVRWANKVYEPQLKRLRR